jgi:hypothetical protein
MSSQPDAMLLVSTAISELPAGLGLSFRQDSHARQ